MAEQSNLAQAREVDDLIDKLREYRDKESQQEQAVKMASEKLKKEKATLEEIIGKKNKVIDELSGKTVYPLFDQIKKMEAEQDKLESEPTEPIEPTQEAEALAGEQPTLLELTQITLERVGETNEKVKLTLGERSVELTLETIELRLVGADPEEYGTFDQICDAGWAEIQKLEQGELLELFNEFAPVETELNESATNVVNFLKPDQSEQAESVEETAEDDTLEDEPTEKPLPFEVELAQYGRISITQGNTNKVLPLGSTDKILDYYGVKSVNKLTQKSLKEIWHETIDYSNKEKLVVNEDKEDWPDQIMPLRKPDGSVILKLAGRTRKIDAKDIAPGDVDFGSQDELNALWLSDKAIDHNPEHELAPAIEGKRARRKKTKPAEVTA